LNRGASLLRLKLKSFANDRIQVQDLGQEVGWKTYSELLFQLHHQAHVAERIPAGQATHAKLSLSIFGRQSEGPDDCLADPVLNFWSQGDNLSGADFDKLTGIGLARGSTGPAIVHIKSIQFEGACDQSLARQVLILATSSAGIFVI